MRILVLWTENSTIYPGRVIQIVILKQLVTKIPIHMVVVALNSRLFLLESIWSLGLKAMGLLPLTTVSGLGIG